MKKLFAFWRYDCFPYVLGAEVEEIRALDRSHLFHGDTSTAGRMRRVFLHKLENRADLAAGGVEVVGHDFTWMSFIIGPWSDSPSGNLYRRDSHNADPETR